MRKKEGEDRDIDYLRKTFSDCPLAWWSRPASSFPHQPGGSAPGMERRSHGNHTKPEQEAEEAIIYFQKYVDKRLKGSNFATSLLKTTNNIVAEQPKWKYFFSL